MRWYVVGAVVVVAVVGGAFAVSSLLAAAVALALVTVGVAAYERRYEVAAARTRERLS
jgi:nicotinamide riboside kinase